MEKRRIGVVVKLTDKGFGFIDLEEGGRPVSVGRSEDPWRHIFFHANEIRYLNFEEMFEGQKVQFRLEKGQKGVQAREIELLEFTSDETEDSVRALDDNKLSPGRRYEIATSTDPAVIVSAIECTEELIRYIAKHPEDLDRIHAGVFEEIVATIFQSEGFETERITSWNQPDGGVDLIAIRKLGSENPIRIAVQCKRYLRDRRISAEPIRSLSGVLDRFHAHMGVVATTTYFTRPAKKEVRHIWRVSLRDYDNIVESIRKLDLLRQ